MKYQRINDLDLAGPFRVYDVDREQFVFSRLDLSAPGAGDLPPDVAFLPVLAVHWHDDVMIIDTAF